MLAILALATQPGMSHEFVFLGDADRVSVAGSFNGWSAQASPMKRGTDGIWRRREQLPIGRHTYKFVLNGSNWVVDPMNSRKIDDGAGNTNSLLEIFPVDYASAAAVGDGVIAQSVVAHKAMAPQLWVHRGTLGLSVQLRPGDVQSATAVVNGRRYPMALSRSTEFLETRRVVIPQPKADLSYTFEIRDGGTTLHLGANGVSESPAAPFRVSRKSLTSMSVPSWTAGTVFYQIFADRFANGSRANDPENTTPWTGKPEYYNWFGGDIAGLNQKAGHLQNLGIQAIYFNPIFYGPSNHRYETTDYKRIDPRFGTNEEFKALTWRLRQMGIRVILDGVFNHTSVDFPQFKSIREEGEKSPFLNWYFIRSFPVVPRQNPPYEAWFGYESMPKVNLDYRPAREYMLSVADYWLKNAAIDGWRLDVANEVSMDFWRAFRTKVKGINPEAWIVGEVWTDGSPWLSGDQWDSIMGYQFRDQALRFIARNEGTASDFLNGLFGTFESYSPQVSHNLMNLISSHDTPRFLNECGGDERLARLGAFALLTWPGAPSIYYGDELGMEGGKDPDNRRGMAWDRATPENPTLALHRRLIAARKSLSSLALGDPVRMTAWDDQQSLAFGRQFGADRSLVFINRSDKEQTLSLTLPPAWRSWSASPLRDVVGNARISRPAPGVIRLTLASFTGAVIAPSSSAKHLSN